MSILSKLAASGWVNTNTTVYADDVFTAFVYEGTGALVTHNTGNNFATGGASHSMFQVRRRDVAAAPVFATSTYGAETRPTNSQTASFTPVGGGSTVISGATNGFNIGGAMDTSTNAVGGKYVMWGWKKSPKFFDAIPYTGTGTTDSLVAHSLGVTPGMIMVFAAVIDGDINVWHRSRPTKKSVYNTSAGDVTASSSFGSAAHTATHVCVSGDMNIAGREYNLLVFAHNTAVDGLIQCGSFTTNGSGQANITLPWEAQYLELKRVDSTGDWLVLDSTRGFTTYEDSVLKINTTEIDTAGIVATPNANGFTVEAGLVAANATYIYRVVRRRQKRPLNGTEVFSAVRQTGTGASANLTSFGFPIDLLIAKDAGIVSPWAWSDRLRGKSKELNSAANTAEATFVNDVTGFDLMNGLRLGTGASGNLNTLGNTYILRALRRYPEVFEIVNYSTTSVPHGLEAVPELIISKCTELGNSNWFVYHKDFLTNFMLLLNSNAGKVANTFFSAVTLASFGASTASSASVVSATVTNGGLSSSSSTPSVSFSGGGGSGATGYAVTSYAYGGEVIGGSIGSVSISSGGTGYTSSPSVSFTGGGGSGATGVGILSGIPTSSKVTSVSVGSMIGGYSSAPTVTFSATGAIGGAIATGYANMAPYPGSGTIGGITLNPGTAQAGAFITCDSFTVFASLDGVNPAPGGGSFTAYVLRNDGGAVTGINVLNGGSGYTQGAEVVILNNAVDRGTRGYINVGGGGVITSIVITNTGSGYGNDVGITPTIAGPGAGGSFTAIVTNYGKVYSINNFVQGSGYLQNPGVCFSGLTLLPGYGSAPGFAGAWSGGTVGASTAFEPLSYYVSSIVVSSEGNYTSTPSVTIGNGPWISQYQGSPSPTFGTPPSATANMTSLYSVQSVTMTNAGSGYTSLASVVFAGGGGSGVTATANMNYSYSNAYYTVTNVVITNGGVGYTSSPSVTLGEYGGASASANLGTADPGNYVAYAFATKPGISKVSKYTGNGGALTVDCGFLTGARLILIKRSDGVGDWFIWDSVTGIGAGNDPHTSLNTTAAEVTTDNSIGLNGVGFTVTENVATHINILNAEYIYLAIA